MYSNESSQARPGLFTVCLPSRPKVSTARWLPSPAEKPEPSKVRQLSWVAFAGALSRLVELPLGHTMNRMRIWYNSNPYRKHGVKTVYQEGGWKNFFKGINWAAISAVARTSARWTTVYGADLMVSTVVSKDRTNVRAVAIGILGPAITVTTFGPLDRIITLTVTKKPNLSLRQHFKQHGRIDLWRGIRPMFMKTAGISIVFNTAYTNLLTCRESTISRPIGTLDLMGVALLSGMTSAAVTTPVDMVKDQMQMHKGLKDNRFFPALLTLYKQHGLLTIFRTLPLKVVRSAWYFAMTTLVMYKLDALPPYMRPRPRISDDNEDDEEGGEELSPKPS